MNELAEGRIVRYVLPGGRARPAIITGLTSVEGVVNLQVFLDGVHDGVNNPADLTEWHGLVAHSDEPKPGTWHWPPRA